MMIFVTKTSFILLTIRKQLLHLVQLKGYNSIATMVLSSCLYYLVFQNKYDTIDDINIVVII